MAPYRLDEDSLLEHDLAREGCVFATDLKRAAMKPDRQAVLGGTEVQCQVGTNAVFQGIVSCYGRTLATMTKAAHHGAFGVAWPSSASCFCPPCGLCIAFYVLYVLDVICVLQSNYTHTMDIM